jgi:hypothetical protein
MKLMIDNNIFIHIPKTGGTTITTAITNKYWASEPNFNYRHIIEKTKKSNSGDIFDPSNFEKYKENNLFMMLRHPVDKVISEYYFFKEREVLMSFFRRKPLNFESYIKNIQSQNATINFLKGRRLYDITIPTESDLDDIFCAIDQIPIHVGIFEDFTASMQLFSNITGIKWNKKIDVKRITLKRPGIQEISEETKRLIIEHNSLDLELYNYCLDRFNLIKNELKVKNIKFIKDKYNHVIPYVTKTCFFEFCMENKKFIKQNFLFFKSLTFFLLEDLNIKDGLVYTETWNRSFLLAINNEFSGSLFVQKINQEIDNINDPLQQTIAIAKAIDDFFIENTLDSNKYYKPLFFNKELIIVESSNKQKGIIRRLFGK